MSIHAVFIPQLTQKRENWEFMENEILLNIFICVVVLSVLHDEEEKANKL